MRQSGSWYTHLRDWWEGLLSGWGLQGKCMSVLSLRWLGVGCENTQKSNLGVAKIWIERLEEVWNPNSLVPTGTWAVSPHPFWLDFSNWGDVWVCWPPSNAELPCCTEIQKHCQRWFSSLMSNQILVTWGCRSDLQFIGYGRDGGLVGFLSDGSHGDIHEEMNGLVHRCSTDAMGVSCHGASWVFPHLWSKYSILGIARGLPR